MWAIGKRREKGILDWISEQKIAERCAIERMFFGSKVRAQAVLTRMYNKKKLNRYRDDQYVYFIGSKPKNANHILHVNRFKYEIDCQLRSWQKILYYKTEVPYIIGVADAFYVVQTTIEGGGRKFFFECDTATNPFDKVEKYTDAYKSMRWKDFPWADPKGSGKPTFPGIIIMTVRPEHVRNLIEKHNTEKLIFKVCTLEEARKDVVGVITS